MSDQASIFIGSSTEALDYANALQRVLDHHLITTVWNYGVFMPGGNTLEDLLARAETTDYAALFLTPDDEVVRRGEYLKTPRDNLVFELGLFIGQIGSRRTFLLSPRESVDLPSDLQGITPITYRTDRGDGDIQNAVNPAATDIRAVVNRHKRRPAVQSEGQIATAATLDGAAAAADVLLAISRLGALAAQAGMSVEVNELGGSRFEVVALDDTRLGTSVEIDLRDVAAVRVLEGLERALTEPSEI
jgi:predicted nucleotide-binding protein with TIR-like domain